MLNFKKIEISDNYVIQETTLLHNASIQLEEYFLGERNTFDLKIKFLKDI